MTSMTGFGMSEVETSLGKIIIETRSENYRFLDINLQIPEALLPIEQHLNEIVKKYIFRGKIRIIIVSEGLKKRVPSINFELAKQTYGILEKIKKELSMEDQTSLEHFLMIKEFFSYEAKPAISKKHLSKIVSALNDAVLKLYESRISEGKKIEKDLKHRTLFVEKTLNKIKSRRKSYSKVFSDNLKSRIEKLFEGIRLDENRLHQEIALLAEKTDITEEIVRLGAHITKFKETMKKNGSIGRECDFLLQEMNREAGTISAKSKDASISHFIIDLRLEIEKMREQAQNIE